MFHVSDNINGKDVISSDSVNEAVPGSTLEGKQEETGENLGHFIFIFHVQTMCSYSSVLSTFIKELTFMVVNKLF